MIRKDCRVQMNGLLSFAYNARKGLQLFTFEALQNERADFFIAVKVSDTTMSNRNSAADNKKIIMFISTDVRGQA